MVKLVMVDPKDPNESQRLCLAGGLSMIALGMGLVFNDGLPLSSLWPFFPLGLARRDVADYLRRFLATVEAG